MKEIVKIPTTSELELNIQRVECYVTNDKGKRRIEDEVCLMISGYDPDKEQVVEEIVTISLIEAKSLANILTELSNLDK